MECDTAIVGAGLAGTTLAWHLLWAGERVVLFDRGDAVTASRVAAGLVTPVTGKRLAPSRGFAELVRTAETHYRRAEAETGANFYHARPAVRLFQTIPERDRFTARDAELAAWTAPADPPAPAAFASPLGAFAMPAAARLDVPAYLDASRRVLPFVPAEVDPASVELSADGVKFPGGRARRLVFCQGYSAAANPLSAHLPFRPAKGEVLTLRLPSAEPRVVHHAAWLAPLGHDAWLCGATYSWHAFDTVPTAEARAELLAAVAAFVTIPVDVTDHRAAVRPILHGGEPRFVPLSPCGRLTAFNGLGSKGVLTAPTACRAFKGLGV